MDDPRIHETSQWMLKARHDLLSAERLYSGDPALLDTAAYHCQQTMEKTLKAYLTYHEIPFQKIHHLAVLVTQCTDVDPSFDQLFDIADMLTPYAVLFRYPGDVLEPEIEDVEEAISAAKYVWRFVAGKIPEIEKIVREDQLKLKGQP